MMSIKLAAIVTLSLCGYVCAAPSAGAVDQPPTDPTLLARYIMLKTDWLSLATISSLQGVTGYPFVSLKSTSDGLKTSPSGIPYLYMTDLETTSIDVQNDDRVTVMASLAQTDYCKKKNYDPQNPLCAKLFIVGKFVRLDKTSSEYDLAKNALFEKHPEMKTWPEDHGFYLAKVDPIQIRLLGFHGPVKVIPKTEYLTADVSGLI